MRIGELLVERGLLDEATLGKALADQAAEGMRLGSLLILRGKVTFDHVSRVLGEQRKTAALLRRHLQRRDKALAHLLPKELARGHCALPIGRLDTGAMIVGVRDPSPTLVKALSLLLPPPLVLAVTPARYLEQAIEAAFDDSDIPIDVDLPEEIPDEFEPDIPIEFEPPPPKTKRAATLVGVAVKPVANSSRDPLDATLTALRDVDEPEWMFDVLLRYLATQWPAALLLEVRGARAIGLRDHRGSSLRTLVVDHPVADNDEAVNIALGTFEYTMQRVADRYVIVAGGEPLAKSREDALVDLDLLADAMSSALARL